MVLSCGAVLPLASWPHVFRAFSALAVAVARRTLAVGVTLVLLVVADHVTVGAAHVLLFADFEPKRRFLAVRGSEKLKVVDFIDRDVELGRSRPRIVLAHASKTSALMCIHRSLNTPVDLLYRVADVPSATLHLDHHWVIPRYLHSLISKSLAHIGCVFCIVKVNYECTLLKCF